MGKVLLAIFVFILVYGLCSQFAMVGMKYGNPIYVFHLEQDEYDGTNSVSFRNTDDKFAYFWISFLWLPLLIFYYIPIGIFKILKFFVNAIGWIIAKLFKL